MGKKKGSQANGQDEDVLTPAEIKAIRNKLKLSQVDAGDFIGGGARAFAKYESGVIKPSTAVIKLLKLLDSNPAILSSLSDTKRAPIDATEARPFEVKDRHVAELKDRQLILLMKKLLSAEAQAHSISMDGVHISSELNSADGGEDARVSWQDGPERTAFLPSRLNQFQLKAGKISPNEAGKELLNNAGHVKARILDTLRKGGCYTIMCSQPYNKKLIEEREKEMIAVAQLKGATVKEGQLNFRSAEQIALWVNTYPSVATWLFEQTQPGLTSGFHTWAHWSGHSDHENIPFIINTEFASLQKSLRDTLLVPKEIVRVVGFSGVGKSRQVMEAFRPTEDEELQERSLSDLVLYAEESISGAIAIKNTVQNLADTGMRAIVVIDNCREETRKDIAAMVKRSSSRLSLLTIESEIPQDPLPDNVFKISLAESSITEGMIKHFLPSLPSEDERRLVKFSKGYPKIAGLIARSWSQQGVIINDDSLIDNIVVGARPKEPDMLREAAALLSVFSVVGYETPLDTELESVATLGRNVKSSDLRVAIDDFLQRGMAQRRGRSIIMGPRPIILHLAEKQWRQWGISYADKIFADKLGHGLEGKAAQQLALLNITSIAVEVMKHLCRYNGPLDSLKGLEHAAHTKILSPLAEIHGETLLNLLEHVFEGMDLQKVAGPLRRELVWALNKVSFDPENFDRAAKLLLGLAVAENETWGNNATGEFVSLFPVFLGDTAADGNARLQVLDDVIDTTNAAQLKIVVQALLEGTKTAMFSRSVGSETHGSKPALQPWHPKTWGDVSFYIKACMERLVKIALMPNEVGLQAKHGLGHKLRSYVIHGYIEQVENIVEQVTVAQGSYWPEALESLGDVIVHDLTNKKADKVTGERVKILIEKLQPKDLDSRIKFLVTEMPWDYPCDEKLSFDARSERQEQVIKELVDEILKTPDVLKQFLIQLSQGQQRMTVAFGKYLGHKIDRAEYWLAEIKDALKAVNSDKRNFGLLGGYLAGMQDRLPAIVSEFKKQSVKSDNYAPALPFVCLQLGIKAEDIKLVCEALSNGKLPVGLLMNWTLGGVFAKLPPKAVVPLFDTLFSMDDQAYTVALDLLGMYVHNDYGRLDKLKPQVRKMAEVAFRKSRSSGSQLDTHHFQEIMKWILDKGRADPDASAAALSLVKEVAKDISIKNEDFIKPLIPRLLSNFPEIVWPVISQAIASDRKLSWRFEHLLGDTFSFSNRKNAAILSLPEDVLFAWCHAMPDVGPAFVAVVAPLLIENDNLGNVLHPLVKRLLNEFGDREDVLSNLDRNMHTFGWSGSVTTYFALYHEPLRSLLAHPKEQVRKWARKTLQRIRLNIQSEKNREEEQEAMWEL